MMKISRRWRNPRHPAPGRAELNAFCRTAATAAGLPAGEEWALELLFVGDREMTRYNREIVGHEGTTDVITLSYFDDSEGRFPGDVALELIVNPDAAAREGARRSGSCYAREMALYVVHGMLHAAGEDDLAPVPRKRMRRREREALAILAGKFDFLQVFPE